MTTQSFKEYLVEQIKLLPDYAESFSVSCEWNKQGVKQANVSHLVPSKNNKFVEVNKSRCA